MINDSVSVIIRTKNEERWIGYAVQSVLTNLADIVEQLRSCHDTFDLQSCFENLSKSF